MTRYRREIRRAKVTAALMWDTFCAYVRSGAFDFKSKEWPMRGERASGWGQRWRLSAQDFSEEASVLWRCPQTLGDELWKLEDPTPALVKVALNRMGYQKQLSYDDLYDLARALQAAARAFARREVVWLPTVVSPARTRPERVGRLLVPAEPRAADFAHHSPFRYLTERANAHGMELMVESEWRFGRRVHNPPWLQANIVLALSDGRRAEYDPEVRPRIVLSAGACARLECRNRFEI